MLHGAQQNTWFARVDREQGNLRGALQRAEEQGARLPAEPLRG